MDEAVRRVRTMVHRMLDLTDESHFAIWDEDDFKSKLDSAFNENRKVLRHVERELGAESSSSLPRMKRPYKNSSDALKSKPQSVSTKQARMSSSLDGGLKSTKHSTKSVSTAGKTRENTSINEAAKNRAEKMTTNSADTRNLGRNERIIQQKEKIKGLRKEKEDERQRIEKQKIELLEPEKHKYIEEGEVSEKEEDGEESDNSEDEQIEVDEKSQQYKCDNNEDGLIEVDEKSQPYEYDMNEDEPIEADDYEDESFDDASPQPDDMINGGFVRETIVPLDENTHGSPKSENSASPCMFPSIHKPSNINKDLFSDSDSDDVEDLLAEFNQVSFGGAP